MIIREIEIKAFGRLENRCLHLGDGMNVIQGENETGKTTLHEFIRAMLFGMERGRGRASREDAYTRFRPWHAAGGYGGRMDVEVGGKKYRLIRDFTVDAKNLHAYDLETGAEVPDFEDRILRAAGLNESSFRNACLVTQGNHPSAGELSASLGDKMIHLATGGDRELAASQAISWLEERKRQLGRKKLAVRLSELTEERQAAAKLEQELFAVKAEYQELSRRLSVEEPDGISSGSMLPQEAMSRQETTNSAQTGGAGLFYFTVGMAALFLYLILGALLPDVVPSICRQLLTLFLVMVAVFWRMAREKKKKQILQSRQEEREANLEERGKLSARIEALEKQLESEEESEQEYQKLLAEYREQTEQLEILDAAADILKQVSTQMKEGFGTQFQQKLQQAVRSITDGTHEQLYLDDDFQIRLEEQKQIQPLERFSKGTVEQIYLVMSLSAGQLLFTEEMPLLLDDALVHYDDERVERALKYLMEEHPGQILLCSCTAREAECLEEAGIAYRYLNMKEELKD